MVSIQKKSRKALVSSVLLLVLVSLRLQAYPYYGRQDFSVSGAGRSPRILTSDDFNGDGFLDLAVPVGGGGGVSIFLNKGDGTFSAPASFATGSVPAFALSADFNGDGKKDLAVTNGSIDAASAVVSILPGNGDGTFGAKTDYPVNLYPGVMAGADFNGDGKLDLAVDSWSTDRVAILLGNGDGTFPARLNYNSGSNQMAGVAAGDFNGDGKADLGVGHHGAGKVSIALGNGDGTFMDPVHYAAGAGAGGITVDDWNRDGRQDLGVANQNSNNVAVLLGNGDGTFRAGVSYATGLGPLHAVSADLNGDGIDDFAVNNYSSRNVSTLLGNGDGTFRGAVNYGVGTRPYGIVAADFNMDGVVDIVTSNFGGFSVSVLLSTGTRMTESEGSTRVAEGGAADTYTIALLAKPSSKVTVSVDAGTQLQAAPSTLTFTSANWNAPQTVAVSAVNDLVYEDAHTGTLSHAAASADPAYNGVSLRSMTVPITDDDPFPSLSLSDTVVFENAGTASVAVLLSNPHVSGVSVLYAASDGTATAGDDYAASDGSLTWGPGEGGAKTFALPVVADRVKEPDETVRLSLSRPVNADVVLAGAVLTITDESDLPSLSVNNLSAPESMIGDATLTVSMTGLSSSPVSVDYATADGSALGESDFKSLAGTLTWNPGETGDKKVSIPVIDDLLDEPDETLSLILSDPSNAALSAGKGALTLIDDDDPPVLSVADAAVAESTGGAALTVTMRGASAAPVTVDYTTSDGTATAGDDYAASQGTLSWPAGQTDPKTIVIPILNDESVEPDKALQVELSKPSHASLGNAVATLTIRDDDEAAAERQDTGNDAEVSGNIGGNIGSDAAPDDPRFSPSSPDSQNSSSGGGIMSLAGGCSCNMTPASNPPDAWNISKNLFSGLIFISFFWGLRKVLARPRSRFSNEGGMR